MNVRKRNESEDDDEERDEALPSQPPPPPPGGDGPAAEPELPAPKPPLLPLPTGCVPLVSPSSSAPSSGGGFAFSTPEVVGRGGSNLPAPELQPPQPPMALVPPPPPPSQQLPLGNNGLSPVSKPKERKKGKEWGPAPGVPRGSRSLLSFQDEEEGKQHASTRLLFFFSSGA